MTTEYEIDPDVVDSFKGLVPDDETILWAGRPAKPAIRKEARRMLIFGGELFAGSISLLALASLGLFTDQFALAKSETGVLIGVGIFILGLSLLGFSFVTPVRFLLSMKDLSKEAYLVTNKTLMVRWNGNEAGIVATRAPVVVQIGRKVRAKSSDINVVALRDDKSQTDVAYLRCLENGEQIQNLIENVLLGQGTKK